MGPVLHFQTIRLQSRGREGEKKTLVQCVEPH
jgi:hypothetical protein